MKSDGCGVEQESRRLPFPGVVARCQRIGHFQAMFHHEAADDGTACIDAGPGCLPGEHDGARDVVEGCRSKPRVGFLAGVAGGRPRKGDYIVDADQTIFAVYGALSILGGRVWKISAQETMDEDFGSVAVANTTSEDRGDLVAATSAEDYGALYT